MNNLDSQDIIEARKNQEDPIVMYLIVRESLGMGMGKTAAQCAHASQMLQLKFNEESNEAKNGDISKWFKFNNIPDIKLFEEWLNTSFRKVVLSADEKEWKNIKALEYKYVLVIDNGLTEISPGSETVIGFFPMKKSNVPKIIKRLQTLK